MEPIGFTNYSASAGEYTGYSTQKPLELYGRLIKASSNPGDVVLDIFAGCATTAIAAEKLGRDWIACDMAYRSWTMLKRRFYQIGIQLEGMSEATLKVMGELPLDYEIEASVIGPNELPNGMTLTRGRLTNLSSRSGVADGPPSRLRGRGKSAKRMPKNCLSGGSGRCAGDAVTNRVGPTAVMT